MNETEFSELANRGWTLIAIIQEKNYKVGEESNLVCPGPPTPNGQCKHGSWSNCTIVDSFNVPVEYTETKYVMGRDEDTIIGDLSQQLEDKNNECERHLMQIDKLVSDLNLSGKAVKKMENESDCAERSADNYRTQIAEQDDRIVGHLKTINKMETDLAKVREHFGRVQFEAALKEDKEV